jgi:F0F1-type ATP synthase membrane subunit b/b'
MTTVTVSSIESFVAAVEAAAHKAEAEQQLAPIEEALRKARALRALVGEEVISQGEALLEQTWAEAQAEVTRGQRQQRKQRSREPVHLVLTPSRHTRPRL